MVIMSRPAQYHNFSKHETHMITYGQPHDQFSGTYEAKNARIGAW
jgi:hypothetical protein